MFGRDFVAVAVVFVQSVAGFVFVFLGLWFSILRS